MVIFHSYASVYQRVKSRSKSISRSQVSGQQPALRTDVWVDWEESLWDAKHLGVAGVLFDGNVGITIMKHPLN